MKKALISPAEIRYGDEQQTQSGYRIAEVTDAEFVVAEPMFWIDVADDITADSKYYDPADQQLKDIWRPSPPPVEEPTE